MSLKPEMMDLLYMSLKLEMMDLLCMSLKLKMTNLRRAHLCVYLCIENMFIESVCVKRIFVQI